MLADTQAHVASCPPVAARLPDRPQPSGIGGLVRLDRAGAEASLSPVRIRSSVDLDQAPLHTGQLAQVLAHRAGHRGAPMPNLDISGSSNHAREVLPRGNCSFSARCDSVLHRLAQCETHGYPIPEDDARGQADAIRNCCRSHDGGGGQSDRRRGGDLRRHLQRSNSTRHLAATLRAKVFTISSLAWFSNEPTMHCNEATNPAGRDHPIALRPPHRRAAEAVSGARRTCCLCGHEEEGACGGLRKRGSGMATRELALNPFARMTSSIVNKVVPYGICDCHCA